MSSIAPHNETELLEQIALGDELAFRKLFNSYWTKVYGICYHFTKCSEQARDLAQDVFVKIWKGKEKLPAVNNFDSFLYVVSRNLVLNFFRKKVLTFSNIDVLLDRVCKSPIDVQTDIEYKELNRSINNAIEVLPAKVKEVFVLHRFEGLTHEQIAQRLNISIVSSKTYIVRALRQIREYLSKNSETFIPFVLIVLKTLEKKF